MRRSRRRSPQPLATGTTPASLNLLRFPIFTPWPVISMLVVHPWTGAMYDLDVPTAVLLKEVAPPPDQ